MKGFATWNGIGNLRVNAQALAVMAVAAFAIATVFTTGFLQNSLVHEVFHDLRHAIGLPCH
jgi:cobalt transporter subunit CbtB